MSLLLELSKINRKAALIFNREIKLKMKRGKLSFDLIMTYPIYNDLFDLVDSFNWKKTRQGYDFWDRVFSQLKD